MTKNTYQSLSDSTAKKVQNRPRKIDTSQTPVLDTFVHLIIVATGIVLALFILGFGAIAWVFRDGMGPNSVTTYGIEAVMAVTYYSRK